MRFLFFYFFTFVSSLRLRFFRATLRAVSEKTEQLGSTTCAHESKIETAAKPSPSELEDLLSTSY